MAPRPKKHHRAKSTVIAQHRPVKPAPSSAHLDDDSDTAISVKASQDVEKKHISCAIYLATLLEDDQNSERVPLEKFFALLEQYNLKLMALCDPRNSDNPSSTGANLEPYQGRSVEDFVKDVECQWSSRTTAYLIDQSMKLSARLDNGTISRRNEVDFIRLGKQLLYAEGAVSHFDHEIIYPEWVKYSPIVYDPGLQEVLDCLDDGYRLFQQSIYYAPGTREDLTLWYLIWINLKQIFEVVFHNIPDTLFSLELEFFDDDEELWGKFEWVTQRLDAQCPTEIEDLVGEYCKYIHSLKPDSYHFQATKPYDCTQPLDDEAFTILSTIEFACEEEPHAIETAIEALHNAVLRLNYLTRGPAVLRRLGGQYVFYLAEELPTDPERLEYYLPTIPHSPVWIRTTFSRTSNNEITSTEEVVDVRVDEKEKSDIADSYMPRGRNIISAYDYVYCPIPENRAYEVANSRLISRDLRDPGIVSDGLRTADVVNLPPLHCRTPGTWDLSKKRIPLGPYEIFGMLGSSIIDAVLRRRSKPQTRPKVLPSPYVTSREDCRHYRHKSKSRAKHGPNMRVAKPQSSRNSGLRGGGGPRYIHGSAESPSKAPG